MPVIVTVVTTNNSTHSFALDSAAPTTALGQLLQRGAHLFSGKPLIFGSDQQTELFAAESLVSIEVSWPPSEDRPELAAAFPASPQNPEFSKIEAAVPATVFAGGLDGEQYAVRLEFHFEGGHHLACLAEGVRRAVLAERRMNLTRLFEHPFLSYRLPGNGFGLINPKTLHQVTITPGVPDLPSDALPATRTAN